MATSGNPAKTRVWLLFLLYTAGLVSSAYLVSISVTGESPFCLLFGSDCASVVGSEFGKLGGLPVSTFGLAYFACQLILLVMLFRGALEEKKILRISVILNILALSASLSFLYLLIFVLKENCTACLSVHLVNIATFVVLFPSLKNGIEQKITYSPADWFPPIFALSAALALFLGVNLFLSQSRLHAEQKKLGENLQYHLFVHSQNREFEFAIGESDKVFGKPDKAIHQIVLIYKDGCKHCLAAKKNLVGLVGKYEEAVYLLMRNYKDMDATRLKELKVGHVPVVFINGRRADGWEIPGFMDLYTENCGC